MAPALRTRCALCATAVVAAALWMCSTALATTITPNTVQDVTVNNDGLCSLREAITASFTHNPSGATPGECPAGTGGDVIDIGAGHYVLTGAANDDLNASGDLDIRSSLTIKGSGATIDANLADRVLDIKAGQAVTIDGVTITGGKTPAGGNGAPSLTTDPGGNGNPGQPGGGILNAGTLTILNSVVTGNTTGAGGQGGSGTGPDGQDPADIGEGGSGGNGGAGGGISSSGTLTVDHSTISSNRTGAGGNGGPGFGGDGVDGSGTTNGTNGATGFGGIGGKGGSGGGIDASAPLTVVDSAISHNGTGNGGVGALGVGGRGGNGGSTSGAGGSGDSGEAGRGGDGGLGGGLQAQNGLTMRRSVVDGNTTGTGGTGGPGNGGTGGAGHGGSQGGHGGNGDGERGGPGGTTAGVAAFGASTIVNTTVTGNVAGAGGTGGNGVAGSGGLPGGAPGSANPGGGGDGGGAAGVIDNPQVNLVHDTITSNAIAAGGPAGTPVPQAGGPTTPATAGAAGVGGGVFGIGSLTLEDSIIAFNTGANCAGAVTSGGHDLTFGDATCPGTNADPQLGVLQNNGGPTATQAIAASSPARDAVPASAAGCEATDQRGVTRPQGPACDIGAFELVTGGGLGGAQADTVAPVFGSASMVPNVFAVDRKGKAELAVSARKRPKKGTTLRYTLSESARVVFTIQKPAAGRKVGKKCKKPTRKNRRKHRCTRFVRVGRFALASVAGKNSHKFSGRIGRRALKPGRYRAVLVATDAAGNHSRAKTLKFRVVRP